MADTSVLQRPTPEFIRERRAENQKARARDFAETLGITEAELIAAHVGHGVTPIDPTPDRLFPLIRDLGDVMALTRNRSCVHERVGTYEPFHGGAQAAMVLGTEIDMRIFPSHWVHGFAIEEATENGPKRSLQIFDAAGDAVHKVHLRDGSDLAAFDALVAYCPAYVAAYDQRARTRMAAGDMDGALADLETATWLAPDHAAVWGAKAVVLMRLGRFGPADAALDRVLALNPWLPERRLRLAPPGVAM